MKKLLSLALCIGLVLGIAGCRSKEKTIIDKLENKFEVAESEESGIMNFYYVDTDDDYAIGINFYEKPHKIDGSNYMIVIYDNKTDNYYSITSKRKDMMTFEVGSYVVEKFDPLLYIQDNTSLYYDIEKNEIGFYGFGFDENDKDEMNEEIFCEDSLSYCETKATDELNKISVYYKNRLSELYKELNNVFKKCNLSLEELDVEFEKLDK